MLLDYPVILVPVGISPSFPKSNIEVVESANTGHTIAECNAAMLYAAFDLTHKWEI